VTPKLAVPFLTLGSAAVEAAFAEPIREGSERMTNLKTLAVAFVLSFLSIALSVPSELWIGTPF
jgi:hypothetical protein